MERQFNISPAQFASFKHQAAQHGITIPDGFVGEVNADGCKFDYNYDGTQRLSLTIVSKPFFLSADFIFSQLTPYLTA